MKIYIQTLLAYAVLLLVVFGTVTALALPEYAVRYNQINCTSCHISPTGGGPRNVNGKLFGARGFQMNPWLIQDHVSADLRVIDYYPQRPVASSDGVGVMQGAVGLHAGLDPENKIQLMIEANVAGFNKGSAASRDTYALFQLAPNDGAPHWLQELIVGRFRPAFGIVTDEHRTYTRIQSATEYYTFEGGAQLSGSPGKTFHYDLAVVSGEKSNAAYQTSASVRNGVVLNIRHMPGPFAIGASQEYHPHVPADNSRMATSIYSIISLGRATNDKLPMSVKLEYVVAKNWNSNLGHGFAFSNDYVTQVASAESHGYSGYVDYALNNHFTLLYKYDLLIPDQSYSSDFYERHGVGFKWWVGPNVIFQARTELARATNASETSSTSEGGQDATYGILQIEL